MIGSLFFESSGAVLPTYCLDLLGNLVRCNPSGPKDGLVPYAVEIVSSAGELACPYPWTVTMESLLERLALVAVSRPEVCTAYPGLVLQVAAFPFVPHIEVVETDALVLEAIETLPNLSAEDAAAIREQLKVSGVFEIPAMEAFDEKLHEPTGEGLTMPPIKYVSAGWMSSMKVYRKALIRSA